jgi:lysophospholipase L1-like esterase
MKKTFLALGDSYTIGEGVLLKDNFAYQAMQLLRKYGVEITEPEIIAKTGWTTDELNHAISQQTFLEKYDFVSLLIGVNNQYRGRSVEEYKIEFETLLKKAIAFAENKSNNVFVFSIPDWGLTPFAKDRDIVKIATEIDQYNAACKNITVENNCHFIDITTAQREDAHNAEMLASDGLHPSGDEYSKWAKLLVDAILALDS